MKTAGKLLGTILDLCEQLLIAGAEVWRVEEILEELFEAYCFKRSSLWVNSTGMMATVYTWDDRVYTQIRGVQKGSYDLDKLERLYGLVDEVCKSPTGVNTIREKLDLIISSPGLSMRESYIASILGSAGFCFLYSGSPVDAVLVSGIAIILVYLKNKVGNTTKNKLATNVIAAFLLEILVLIAMFAGIITQPAPATIAGIFLLISGIGLANGISELMHGNTLSGLNETAAALLGALGIAIGITLAMLPFHNILDEQPLLVSASTSANPAISLLGCTAGCTGFAMLMGARKKALLLSAVGAALTYGLYLVLTQVFGFNYFSSTLQCACVVAIYAIIITKLMGIPGAVFRLSCILPLVPGSKLYYAVFSGITSDFLSFRSYGTQMLIIAVAIAFGYIAVDVVTRLLKVATIKRTSRR